MVKSPNVEQIVSDKLESSSAIVSLNMAKVGEYANKRRPEYLDLPEWMKGKPIKDIILTTGIDDIPDGPTCYACRLPTVKDTVRYLYGGEILVRANGPGYRCFNDGLEYGSKVTLLEFEAKAQEILSNKLK